jgi:hypothetical protein
MSTAPEASTSLNPQRVYSRSPQAMGTLVRRATSRSASGCSGSTGSSKNSGPCGSRARTSRFAIARCTRPWKSTATSRPDSRAAARRSAASSTRAYEFR